MKNILIYLKKAKMNKIIPDENVIYEDDLQKVAKSKTPDDGYNRKYQLTEADTKRLLEHKTFKLNSEKITPDKDGANAA